MKNNPLDNIRVASPCPANWDDMFGDDRKRFCGDCKLNVYNLSNMTRRDAEDLLANSEGRLCVRFFRRADGTILTENCPVGWQAVKQRVSRVAAAAFSVFAGLFTGLFAVNLFQKEMYPTMGGVTYEPQISRQRTMPQVGEIDGPQRIAPTVKDEQVELGVYTVGKREAPPRSDPKRK